MAKAAGSARSWLALGGLAAGGLAWQACGAPGAAGDTALAAAVSDALAAVGPSVVLPALADAREAATALQAAVQAWQQSGDAADRAAAQDAWRDTMRAWQRVEVLQIGPAASSLTAVAGADLRDEVYSWPTTNPCRVDQETVAGGYADAAFFDENLVNAYGLDALETVLFGDAGNACPGQVDINADGTWDALGPEGVDAARADYAEVLVGGVVDRVGGLEQTWSPSGGDFSGQLALTNAATPYASEQEALNAVFDALFYLETRTKDRKVAQPLGLRDCATERCPDDVELARSDAGLDAVIANIEGFRLLFTGGDDIGLDDVLVELGHGDLAADLLDRTDAALAAARAVEGPLEEAVVARPEQVEALNDALKAVADLLKGDLATVLSLEVPSEAAGDND
jgi:predicted lipoprotein